MDVSICNGELIIEIILSVEKTVTVPKSTAARWTKNVCWCKSNCNKAIKASTKDSSN